MPTLVLHGADDPMVDLSGGRATATAIPGAELAILDGMGHDLHRALWPEITARIADLVERVETGKSCPQIRRQSPNQVQR